MTQFIHLKTHSAYSLAEGAIKVSALIDLALENRMPAVALTDSGNLFGAMEFALSCADKGLQGIIGCKLPFSLDSSAGEPLVEMTLLAQSQVGYHNLIKLSSKLFIESDASTLPFLTLDQLSKHTQGIILLSGALEGPVHQTLIRNQPIEAQAIAEKLKALFGNRFYLEITRMGTTDEKIIEDALCTLAFDLNIPLVATNEVYFATPVMHGAHDILLCISQSVTASVADRKRAPTSSFFKSPTQMAAIFADLPEAIANTWIIAQRCHFMPEVQQPILPPFESPSGRTEIAELKYQAEEGLDRRLQKQVFKEEQDENERSATRKTYFDRLAYELDIISKMGFSGYFLIVADFIGWAKSQGIPVGPGRGSGAGSIAAWALTITDIDPIAFGLIFERFLNPERVSMPDFDVDFCQDRRDEVIAYVCKKYGADHVAHIITFGKLQARAVLRDVGRVLEMPYGYIDKICKLIPNNPASPVTLEQALNMDPQLRRMMDEDQDVKRLVQVGLQLEGLYRHASTHAAGVVIGDRPLDELVPLYKDARSPLPATQFSMKYVEQAGLLKFDFLGLKTLTVINKACQIIEQETGGHLDITTIPLDDRLTFALLNRVETMGVFQLESGGMRDVLRRLKPDRLEELIALVALYRPGPMDDIPRYLACKHGQETVQYLHPMLEPILKESFGVMVVQEQVMQIAQVMAGYTLGGADLLRRAMGKKNWDEMNAQRMRFVEGAVSKGVSSEIAQSVFDQMSKFAGYGFNKSHAAPYALLTYQTAYLKANHPVAFLCACMTLDMGNIDKINLYRQELKTYNIPLLPPDINQAKPDFSIETLADGSKAVRYGLAAIKNVGHQAMVQLMQEREKNGPYNDIFDLAKRLDTKVINKRQLENLIQAGAFDNLHTSRHSLFDSLDLITQSNRIQALAMPSLFGEDMYANTSSLSPVQEWPLLEKLQREFDALGFFLSAHPLEGYPLDQLGVTSSGNFTDFFSKGDKNCQVAGILISTKERASKTGQRYAFVQLSDAAGQYEVVIFSEILSRFRPLLEPGKAFILQVTGRVDGDQLRLTVQNIEPLDGVMANQPIEITISSSARLNQIKMFCETLLPGKSTIRLKLQLKSGTVNVDTPGAYTLSMEQRAQLIRYGNSS